MSEKENTENLNIDSTNIFDEFAGDESLKQEVEKIKIEKQKDSYYYLGIVNKFLGTLNTIIFLAFIVFGVYIYIQNNKAITNADYLNPICDIFVESRRDNFNCASVSALTKKYEDKYTREKENIYKTNLSLVGDIYSISNFIFSKDVSFLLDRTDKKIRPLQILEEFDKLKNEFEPINKSRITCKNISLNSDYILEMDCSAYSSDWDRKILGFSGKSSSKDIVSGTSMSRASSFINFLEKKEKSKFVLLDKQRKFNYVDIVDDKGYSKRTDFKLKLKYKNNNIIGLQK